MKKKGLLVTLLFFSMIVVMIYIRYAEEYGYSSVTFPEEWREIEVWIKDPQIASIIYAILASLGILGYYITQNSYSIKPPTKKPPLGSRPSTKPLASVKPKQKGKYDWGYSDPSTSRMRTRIVDGVTTYYKVVAPVEPKKIVTRSKSKITEIYECDYCGGEVGYLYRCNKCRGKFCEAHRYERDHECMSGRSTVEYKTKAAFRWLFK